MVYYFIYKDDEFIAHTNKKKMVNDFIRTRKGNFKCRIVKNKEIPDKIFQYPRFNMCGLCYFDDEDNEFLLLESEIVLLEDNIIQEASMTNYNVVKLKEKVLLLRLNKSENEIVERGLIALSSYIDEMVSRDIFDVEISSVINTGKYIEEMFDVTPL